MRGNTPKLLALSKCMRSAFFAIFVTAAAVALTVSCTESLLYAVQIQDGEETRTVYTTQDRSEEILQNFGYVTQPQDEIRFTGVQEGQGEICIIRAFPVPVRADGQNTVVMVTGGNVEDVLKKANIQLAEFDTVNMPLTAPVQKSDVVTVTRKERLTTTEEAQTPYETIAIPTSLIDPGEEHVLVEGQNGLQRNTYERVIVDGKKGFPKLLSLDVIKKPVDKKILVGETAAPISPLDFGYSFDESGEPIGYTRVLRAQRAAGYSAKPGAWTASGRQAVVGHVAVDSRVIPYGSKLFIKSTDGSFVYGYAVAADTGTAIADGLIAIDLFYGTYAESALNGIKSVDIFILDE